MKMPRLSSASRTVLVMLLGIAFLELGISRRFGQIWNLAFQATPNTEPATSKPKESAAPGGTPSAPTTTTL